MSKNYSDQKVYSEEEILDFLIGLDNVYQSQGFIGRWIWRKWHMALETLAIQLTGNALINRQVIQEAEDILREEGYEDDNV